MRSAIPNRTRQRQASATERQPADLLGPAALQLRTDRLRVGARWQRTFAISGYPREVGYGWLTPLLRAWPQLEVSLHIEPFPGELAAQRLHKQRARFESTRRLESERGSLSDLGVAAAAHDAEDLATRLARGQSRLYRAGIYLSISASSEDELAHASERVKALCAAQLLSCAPATLRPLEGWLSTLPLGLDRLRLRRTFDSESLAASFPFAAAEPPLADTGCFYGLSDSGAPVVFDRFACDNYNGVILARSGAGKSYLAKLEALRLSEGLRSRIILGATSVRGLRALFPAFFTASLKAFGYANRKR